jgi:lactoylglutathione lyase
MHLSYVIAFVQDMSAAVAFYRDTLGFKLRFESPGWSEFETGSTTLALHPSSTQNAPGTTRLGLSVPDVREFAARMKQQGYRITREPTPEHGTLLAEFEDSAGVRYSVSGPGK